jgi:hypothetical protein
MDSSYRIKAAELREAAKLAKGEASRKELLVLADQYDLLAETSERHPVSSDPSSQAPSS